MYELVIGALATREYASEIRNVNREDALVWLERVKSIRCASRYQKVSPFLPNLITFNYLENPGDYCQPDDICLDSSVCIKNQCTCTSGLFLQNGKCIPPKGGKFNHSFQAKLFKIFQLCRMKHVTPFRWSVHAALSAFMAFADALKMRSFTVAFVVLHQSSCWVKHVDREKMSRKVALLTIESMRMRCWFASNVREMHT
jgi:hypothetical protein